MLCAAVWLDAMKYTGMHAHILGYPGIWECIPIHGVPVFGNAFPCIGKPSIQECWARLGSRDGPIGFQHRPGDRAAHPAKCVPHRSPELATLGWEVGAARWRALRRGVVGCDEVYGNACSFTGVSRYMGMHSNTWGTSIWECIPMNWGTPGCGNTSV